MEKSNSSRSQIELEVAKMVVVSPRLRMGFDMVPHRFPFLFQIQAFLLTFLSEDPNILRPFHGLSAKQRNLIRGLPKKFVSRARDNSSSLQFFRIPALAVDLFRSAAKLV